MTGKRYPTVPNIRWNMKYVRLKGSTRTEKGKGSGWLIWLSGVGTTLGAGSRPPTRDLDVGDLGMPFRRVSVLRADCEGGGMRAASAAGSTVFASPSKKRVMAIWAFH